MPKGDRLKLKADPEDGTTPVANLLLEAVAMAKLSGQEKGAILYLWRQTYGWADPDKGRLKECKLTLSEWGKGLNITRFRASDILAGLATKNIFFRRTADPWGGYYYSLNTNIATWNSNTINLAKLAESVKIADFGDVTANATVTPKGTVTEKPNSYGKRHLTVTGERNTTVTGERNTLTLYKEIKKKGKERGGGLNNPHLNENIRKVFKSLDGERGYRSTKGGAEAVAIKRMLTRGYTPEQIIAVWRAMKQDKFYQDKELFMMTVENQIGAVLKKSGSGLDSDKYTKQAFGHLVQR